MASGLPQSLIEPGETPQDQSGPRHVTCSSALPCPACLRLLVVGEVTLANRPPARSEAQRADGRLGELG